MTSSSGGGGGGLSGGAIAGIVIGVLAGLLILAAIVFLLLRRRKRRRNNLEKGKHMPVPAVGHRNRGTLCYGNLACLVACLYVAPVEFWRMYAALCWWAASCSWERATSGDGHLIAAWCPCGCLARC